MRETRSESMAEFFVDTGGADPDQAMGVLEKTFHLD
ncbi:hypothetical protein J2S53_001144 [Actinopolyspora lacussalsi]|nr:hypothetical protein [Actinopolyspora lacussalsi]